MPTTRGSSGATCPPPSPVCCCSPGSPWRHWWWRRLPRPIGHAGALAIAVGCIARPLQASWPLRAVSWQAGGRDGVERLCDEIGPGSVAVLAADDRIGITLLPAVRSFCSVEAVAVAPRLVGDAGAPVVDGVVEAVAGRNGSGQVEVVASSPQSAALAPSWPANVREVVVLDTTQVGTTIGQMPSHVGGRRLTVWIGTITPPVA